LHQFAGKRAGERHFEAVEDPGDAQRHDHQEMKAPERQRIKAGRDIGFDNAGLRMDCLSSMSLPRLT